MQSTLNVGSDDDLNLFLDEDPYVEFDYTVPDSSGSNLLLNAEEGARDDSFLVLIQFPSEGPQIALRCTFRKGGPFPIP